jgi:aspartate ammonia-lyase
MQIWEGNKMLAEINRSTRAERDSLGEREIRDDAYYGIHSLRSQENFTVSGYKIHSELIVALAMVKKASAMANMKAGILERRKAMAIARAAEEIIDGKWHEQFIGEAIQGGAGTAINMAANEVITNRALAILGSHPGEYDKVNPIDDANMGQSTNDVLPTAIRIAAIRLLQRCIKENMLLVAALREKADEYHGAIKMGRTHLQDAVPLTIGEELDAWAEAIQRDVQPGGKADVRGKPWRDCCWDWLERRPSLPANSCRRIAPRSGYSLSAPGQEPGRCHSES